MFRNYLRITSELFFILEKVKSAIERQGTDVISSGARLKAMLLSATNGIIYSALKYITSMRQPSLSAIISETFK